jgi:hypothetical protein
VPINTENDDADEDDFGQFIETIVLVVVLVLESQLLQLQEICLNP